MTSQKTAKIIFTRGIVVLPITTVKIEIGRPKSITTLSTLKEGDSVIVVSQINSDVDDPKIEDLYEGGTICTIKKIKKITKEDYEVTLKGDWVIGIDSIKYTKKDGHVAKYTLWFQTLGESEENDEYIQLILDLIISNSQAQGKKELQEVYEYILSHEKQYKKVASFIAENVGADYTKKQEFLEASTVSEKLKIAFGMLVKYYDSENVIGIQVDNEINKKMNDNIAKQQKEFYLRERLRTVKEELGELSSREEELDKIKKKLNANPYPKHIKQKIVSELQKYEIAMSSNESTIIKTYIDWLLDLPWWQEKEDNKDISKVEEILNKNHYGIEKVKERILEYLAIKTKNKNSKSPILCLVGPPGVGKTSLAQSIAEALNKQYVKVSLGGVRDEAEIRGHRKTYIGAMPGRIIKGMKKAEVMNPLFLLDEIDKMGSDHKGDPSSAMLEVLDPEQNSRFSDNYIEEDYDLSKVLFVATANYYNQIPYALIDRLEIIELSSYTINEKREIAKQHLIKRIFEDALLKTDDLKFTDDAIEFIINHYTKEAGVRELERQIRKIVRKYVVDELKGNKLATVVDVDVVKHYLGKIIFDSTEKDLVAIPGIVNGMAYTSAGGDLLPIEASYSKGKGKLLITGNLEKTMNESVNVALGFVRSNAAKFGIDEEIFSKIDIHVHVPAGGVPKDGPSAGVAITSALISMLRSKIVKTDISMTGEITLRGKVGIIGGVKEKVISAHRAGVREIFLPFDDERFLDEIPQEILKDIQIHLVKEYTEIYSKLFN